MRQLTKRQQKISEIVGDARVLHSFDDAVKLLQEIPAPKFVETVDLAINLGVDPRKSDQVVRGSTILPHGSGKKVRVAVFAQGQAAEDAANAGADVVGMEDLSERIKSGWMEFDVVIAAPDAMRVVGQLGQILGPRGLMPNPKVGTVTPNVATAVNNAKSGQVRFRTDKNGVVHGAIGKIDFTAKALRENAAALIADLKKLKPSSSKGQYLKKITLSTTMGPGITLDVASVVAGD